ncbi:MAG: DUF434 domain-containing protein [Phycisphaerae bacterium]|nr:DUF434 domain-containing protein [Phycisphaerae bacterium]MDD5380308.1 DUF434 domain-containing protein [Phycisphaerae bacterium]
MPDKRTHRGPHPADAKLFAEAVISDLRSALADFSLLLTKDYAAKSALKLVGDKFSLTERQRTAIMRSACSDQQLISRKSREVKLAELGGKPIAIDGYNVLITIEAAMSGAFVFKGRDGCFRDLASIHGTYRKVAETIPAVRLIGEFLEEHNAGNCLWLLDSPVSNSGRLKTLIGKLAQKNNWNWEIELLPSPDARLIKTDLIAASSDSVVLDRCKIWVNLARAIIEEKVPKARLVDLS